MKYKLKPYHRNISDKEYLDDLRIVSKKLGKETVTISEYNKHGIYHSDSLSRRFGYWFTVLEKAGLKESRSRFNISAEECLTDLCRVAKKLGKTSVTRNEYKKYGKFSPTPIIRNFGSWFSALDKAGLDRTRNLNITNEQYLLNIAELWEKFGRQPFYGEVSKPLSKYSASAYVNRFGSWRKALETFVEFMDQEIAYKSASKIPQPRKEQNRAVAKHRRKTPRKVNDRLRLLVLYRDNYKCCFCGASPAISPGVYLQVDHIFPWSRGGETVLENLQTLCESCNLGTGDLILEQNQKG